MGLDGRGGAVNQFWNSGCAQKLENLKKYQRGMLPSSSTIGNWAATLESLADQHMPFSEYVSAGGIHNIKFDYDSVLRCALK